VQGPVVPDKLTYIISYRRTYLGVLAKPIIKHFTDYSDAGYYFQDLNARVRWNINSKNTLTLSNYFGGDHGYFNKSLTVGDNPPQNPEVYYNNDNRRIFDWGNNLAVARWESVLSKKMILDISGSASQYKFTGTDENGNLTRYWLNDSLHESVNNYSLVTQSNITNYSTLADLEYFPVSGQDISFGGGFKYYRLHPQVDQLDVSGQTTGSKPAVSNEEFVAKNPFFYIQDEITLFKKITITPGIHFSGYQCKGTDSNHLLKRLLLNYNATAQLSLYASYSEMEQYLHLLSLSRINLASDLWLPSYGGLKPSGSRDLSAGLSFTKGIYSFGLDIYQRKFDNLLAYREGISFQETRTSFLELLTSGTGKSRGLELSMEKTSGKLTGLLSYSYSRTRREFPEINDGQEFYARYDRPHVFKTELTYEFNTRWSLSAIWIFMSGSLQTIPSTDYISWLDYRPQYSVTQGIGTQDILFYRKNNYRLPTYHRLDVSVNYTKKYKRFTGVLNFGVYNLYNEQNPYDVEAENIVFKTGTQPSNYTPKLKRVLDKKVLFPILPFVSYSFEF
jgi:hypothetical protein